MISTLKKELVRRVMLVILTLLVAVSSVPTIPAAVVQAKAANKKSMVVIKATYRKNVEIRNGRIGSDHLFFDILKLRAWAENESGNRLDIPVTIDQYGKYLHTNGKRIWITLRAAGATLKIPVKVSQVKKVKVTLKNLK